MGFVPVPVLPLGEDDGEVGGLHVAACQLPSGRALRRQCQLQCPGVLALRGQQALPPGHMPRRSRREMCATEEARCGAFGLVMSFTPTTQPEVPALSSPAAGALAEEPDAVEYPEGHWIAQSVSHGEAVRQAASALDLHFRDCEDVLVAMELVVYYQRGNNKVSLQPDVQVVFGVGRRDRSTFRVWEEGKGPDFVLEVASPSTAGNDAEHKAQEYARIGVREYWRLDPQGALMASPLEGYEARRGKYSRVQPVASSDGGRHLRSQVLGLDLRSQRQAGATVLVFRDPVTGEEFDGTLAEVERRRRAAEDRASAEAKRASAEADCRREAEDRTSAEAKRANAAEDRVRALEKQLRNLASHNPPPEREP